MTITTTTILTSAAALLVGLVVVGGMVSGPAFATGALLAGGLMLANLVGWRVSANRARALVLAGVSDEDLAAAALPGALMALKFLLLGGAMAALVAWFPPVSVVLGLSVVVAAILGIGALGLFVDLQVGES